MLIPWRVPHRVCNDPQFFEDFHFINQVDEASEAGKTAESIFKRLKAAGCIQPAGGFGGFTYFC